VGDDELCGDWCGPRMEMSGTGDGDEDGDGYGDEDGDEAQP
jgi:hypothetical protein